MGRLISHGDMSADQILSCCSQAIAIINLVNAAAWTIQNSDSSRIIADLSDDIGQVTQLAAELLEPVHEALASHEGKGGAS